MSYYTSV